MLKVCLWVLTWVSLGGSLGVRSGMDLALGQLRAHADAQLGSGSGSGLEDVHWGEEP